jgi:hypothetical protein
MTAIEVNKVLMAIKPKHLTYQSFSEKNIGKRTTVVYFKLIIKHLTIEGSIKDDHELYQHFKMMLKGQRE